jgi:hypothetical protein
MRECLRQLLGIETVDQPPQRGLLSTVVRRVVTGAT